MVSVTFGGIDRVLEGLVEYEVNQLNRTRLACIEIAHLLEQYAITHHNWTPRTWATNATTRGTFDEVADYLYEVVLSAGMDYDVFLEGKRMDGSNRAPDFSKYAWLWPAIVANQREIMDVLVRHLSH